MQKVTLIAVALSLLGAAVPQAEAAKEEATVKLTIRNTLVGATYGWVQIPALGAETPFFNVAAGQNQKVSLNLVRTSQSEPALVVAQLSSELGDIMFACTAEINAKAGSFPKHVNAQLVVFQQSDFHAPECSLDIKGN
jgi:hypothetical protein